MSPPPATLHPSLLPSEWKSRFACQALHGESPCFLRDFICDDVDEAQATYCCVRNLFFCFCEPDKRRKQVGRERQGSFVVVARYGFPTVAGTLLC